MIERICHWQKLAQLFAIQNLCQEDVMCVNINHLHKFAYHKTTNILIQNCNIIFSNGFESLKLVYIFWREKAKLSNHLWICHLRKNCHCKFFVFLYCLICEIVFVDRNWNNHTFTCDLCHRVHNTTNISSIIFCGKHKHSISHISKKIFIHLHPLNFQNQPKLFSQNLKVTDH